MKRFLTAMALACVLSMSALAGEIPTSGSPSPPSVPTGGMPSPAQSETPTPGDLPTSGIADHVSDAALSAFLSMFGLMAV